MSSLKTNRYQIAVSGYITKPKETIYEVQERWLIELGTCPEWGLYDTVECKYVEANWENLGLDPSICDEICALRMRLNALIEKARITRKIV